MPFDDKVRAIAPVSVDAPQLLRSIVEESDGFLSVSEESLQQLSAQFTTTTEKILAAAEMIDDLQSELATMLSELTSNVERARQRTHDLLSESQSTVAAAREEINATTGAFDEAVKVLEIEREHCDAVRTQVESTYDRFNDELSVQHQKVMAQTESLTAETQTFETTADELHTKSQGTIQALSNDLGEKRGEMEQKQDEAQKACETRLSDCETEIQNVLENVVTSSANDLMTRAQESIDTTLRGILDEALTELEGKVDEIIEAITKADEESSDLREEMEPLIKELDGIIQPLKQAIDGVMSLAKKFPL